MKISIEIYDKALNKNINWLESMHKKKGYIGPVVHYWRDSIDYIGPGYDWRYEGLIIGYLNLYKKTQNMIYLDKAMSLGEELIQVQQKNGRFVHSNFESNPNFNGGSTPHESAVDYVLLKLANLLKLKNNAKWHKYFECAKKNILEFYFKELWDEKKGAFFQQADEKTAYVANKNATIGEALLEFYSITKDKEILNKCTKIADFICSLQRENGGILQSEYTILKNYNRVMPFYVARCIPFIQKMYILTKNKKYKNCFEKALDYIENSQLKTGGFYQEEYITGKNSIIRKYPIWGAGCGDIARVLYENGKKKSYESAIKWIFKNQNENGSFRTSYGIDMRQKEGEYTDDFSWKDVLGVVGWNDKIFRLLTLLVNKDFNYHQEKIKPTNIQCAGGFELYEDEDKIRIIKRKETIYVFNKGKNYSTFSKRVLFGFAGKMKFLGKIKRLKNAYIKLSKN